MQITDLRFLAGNSFFVDFSCRVRICCSCCDTFANCGVIVRVEGPCFGGVTWGFSTRCFCGVEFNTTDCCILTGCVFSGNTCTWVADGTCRTFAGDACVLVEAARVGIGALSQSVECSVPSFSALAINR